MSLNYYCLNLYYITTYCGLKVQFKILRVLDILACQPMRLQYRKD